MTILECGGLFEQSNTNAENVQHICTCNYAKMCVTYFI